MSIQQCSRLTGYSSSSSPTTSPRNTAPPPTRMMGPVGGGTLAIQAVHGPSCCSTERPPTYECTLAKILLAISTVNGTLPAYCDLLHYRSIFRAAFYIWCCLNIALGAAIADPVHLVSPPMGHTATHNSNSVRLQVVHNIVYMHHIINTLYCMCKLEKVK